MATVLQYREYSVIIDVAQYQNKRMALRLISPEGEPISSITVNLPDAPMSADEVAIKDHSENEGMLAWLRTTGLVEQVTSWYPTGWVKCPIVRLNLLRLRELT